MLRDYVVELEHQSNHQNSEQEIWRISLYFRSTLSESRSSPMSSFTLHLCVAHLSPRIMLDWFAEDDESSTHHLNLYDI